MSKKNAYSTIQDKKDWLKKNRHLWEPIEGLLHSEHVGIVKMMIRDGLLGPKTKAGDFPIRRYVTRLELSCDKRTVAKYAKKVSEKIKI